MNIGRELRLQASLQTRHDARCNNVQTTCTVKSCPASHCPRHPAYRTWETWTIESWADDPKQASRPELECRWPAIPIVYPLVASASKTIRCGHCCGNSRLPFDMEHSTEQFHVLHSHATHAGVMILVNKRVAKADALSWRVLEQGRVVHAKVYGHKATHNIVGINQQAGQSGNTAWCMQRLQKLDKLLQECSSSQPMIMGGDFNTEVCPNKILVGNSYPPGKPGGAPKPRLAEPH